MRNVRPEVLRFIRLGHLPKTNDIDPKELDHYVDMLTKISGPITREEAVLLAGSVGEDSCFGLVYTLIHLIETTRGGIPFEDFGEYLWNNEWVNLLADRNEKKPPKARFANP